VILNIGSAVTGPEVLLKAISMAANIGSFPKGIITADFDLRNFYHEQMKDETSQNYYFRDQRVSLRGYLRHLEGRGYYIKGNQLNTVPFLYKNDNQTF